MNFQHHSAASQPALYTFTADFLTKNGLGFKNPQQLHCKIIFLETVTITFQLCSNPAPVIAVTCAVLALFMALKKVIQSAPQHWIN